MKTAQIAQMIQSIVADAYAFGYRDITKVYDHPYFVNTFGRDVMTAFKQSITQSKGLYDMVQNALTPKLEAAE